MIIKCPECGHQVSDKAPTCPNCGVNIAGNIVKCSHCGVVYLRDEGFCPNCFHSAEEALPPHHLQNEGKDFTTVQEGHDGVTNSEGNKVAKPPITALADQTQVPTPHKKKNVKTAFVVSLVIACIIFAACLYMYRQALDKREMEEWEIAMKSSDPLLLQQYLDTFKDASQAHRDSIMTHLHAIQQRDDDWTNALMANTRDDFQEYLDKHPDSTHKLEAKLKIDSIDWLIARDANTPESYQEYMRKHDDGEHYDEAEDAMKRIKAKEISGEEKAMAKSVLRNFFLGLNEHSEEAVSSTVSEELTLLDKPNATKSDVIDMMNRFYKENVTSMIWALSDSYDVKKREVGDSQYEYTISINATQTMRFSDAPEEKNSFRITATVNPEHKLSLIRMTKQADEKKEPAKNEEKPAAPKTEKEKTE